MDFLQVEKKWNKKWEETKLYSFDTSRVDKKKYVLEMFSYPSGAKLHLGHWYNYGLTDSYARYMRMKGYEIFQPMGFDAFGLPAENYAIKTGIHPEDSTLKNIDTMEKQLKAMGAMFDWDYEIKTCMPDYYRWTQWCFLQLYKKGLAYRKEAPVNWCESCQTVLANEQVVDGGCERCGTPVKRKHLTQWFFKITDYAERLLDGLDTIDWPEKTKMMQRNWIGKSTGGQITFQLENGEAFTVFTTRADTLLRLHVLPCSRRSTRSRSRSPRRTSKRPWRNTSKPPRGPPRSTGFPPRARRPACSPAHTPINPINGRRIPVYVADYVLATYGTGAVMAVPAHDERDYRVRQASTTCPSSASFEGAARTKPDDLPFTSYNGVLVNSEEFDGLTVEEGKKAVIEKCKLDNAGEFCINYRLRDWLISRQRYWGAPISHRVLRQVRRRYPCRRATCP